MRALRIVTVGTLLLAAGCKKEVAGPHSALILILDGVRTEEFTSTTVSDLTGVSGQDYAEQTWAHLAKDGVTVRAAINPGVTITGPSHAALFTGRPEPYANFSLDPSRGPGVYRPTVPTLFEATRAGLDLPESDTIFITNNDFLAGVTTSIDPAFGEGGEWIEVYAPDSDRPANSDVPVLEELLARIEAGPPKLTVVNFHDVDRAGHYGEGDAYINGVAEVDELLAELWQALRKDEPEYAAGLLTVIVADHGRHRHDEDDGWHNHGDSCTGCREIPLMLLGPTLQGEELKITVETEDLAPTVAAWLGVDLPWATGLPVTEAFDDLDAPVRSGAIDRVESGGHVAATTFTNDRDARSTVTIDGEVVSTPGVFAAEMPALLSTDSGLRTCFRELDLTEDDGFWPWTPRCLAQTDSGWEDMGFPDEQVGAWSRPAMVEREGLTWVAWPQNPNEIADLGPEGAINTALAAWDPASGWASPMLTTTVFPADLTLVATEGGLVLAYGTAEPDPESRYTRKIRVLTTAVDGTSATTIATTDFALDELFDGDLRVERPALSASEATVRVAMVVTTDEGTGIATSSSTDGGRTWGEAEILVAPGMVSPAVTPAWDGDEVVWIAEGDDGAEVCRAAPGGEPSCVSAGSPRVQSFTVADGVTTVVRDGGVGAWETGVVGP